MRLELLASTRLSVAGFLLLGAGVAAAQWHADAAVWLITVPLLLLAVNLAAALVRSPRLRRGGLGLFHFCLLAFLLLAAWGRLTHLDAHLNIASGQEYEAGAVEIDAAGPWHGDGLRRIAFRQGPFSVRYAPGVKREHTTSLVAVGSEPVAPWQAIGDDTPLQLGGYRFYTTSNKGYAPVLTWTPAGGEPVSGAIMLPSYPVNDWQQLQDWQAPAGGHWKFWLRVDKVPEATACAASPSARVPSRCAMRPA